MSENFFDDLMWRGLVHQTTSDEISDWLAKESRTLYAGFDPTADSLHVGSLMPLLLLRRYQRAGHRPIALVGGATGMIGDPSGKSAERNLLSSDQLQANVDGLEKQMKRFLDFDGPSGAIMVNNVDWIGKMTYIEFLRDVGKNFPVNVMMAKDSVKSRLGRDDAGISYTEFSYMLLQAFDFVHLYRDHGCLLQIGGSDQWGNITAGIDLGRRMESAQMFGVTSPLLTKADGSKMGKTESGAIWLSSNRTRPYHFFQYFINVNDDDVGKCLRFLTELTREEIEALDEARSTRPEKRESQYRLAEWMTTLVHGEDIARNVRIASEKFFKGDISELSEDELQDAFSDVPSIQIARDRLTSSELSLIDAFAESGLSKSKGEARRTIQQGGAYVNNQQHKDIDTMLSSDHLTSKSIMVLRSGKKKYALLRFMD